MFCKFSLSMIVVAGLSLSLNAQGSGQSDSIRFRAVLHDPLQLTADLFYTDPTGELTQLNFRPKDLTETLYTIPVNGSLVIYDKEAVDSQNPSESLAASVRLSPKMKRAIVVVISAPAGEKPAYRLLLIDDSEKAFPQGESRVIPLIGAEIGIQAGEHRLSVHPGKITRVPPVKRVNEYNMAQTNFHYLQNDSWITFTERQLQYFDAYRRLFIVHATPGAVAPTVTTIVDTTTAADRR